MITAITAMDRSFTAQRAGVRPGDILSLAGMADGNPLLRSTQTSISTVWHIQKSDLNSIVYYAPIPVYGS